MEKLDIAKYVVNASLAHDAWVFGGYVRDVIVCKEMHFNDIDICCPKDVEPLWIVRGLSTKYKVEKYNIGAEYSSLVDSYLINDIVVVQFVLYDGEFSDWVKDYSVDMTCNLFYQSRNVHIGIRYIPDEYRMRLNPVDDILTMTKNKVFERISDPASSYKALKLLGRMRNMVLHYGWTCRNEIMGPMMVLCQDSTMHRLSGSIIDFQDKQKKKELEKYSMLHPYLIEAITRDYQ